jgi:prevent-host-death family protein
MTKTLPISAVKTHLPALLDGVAEREDEIVVTRNGTPTAVILNYFEYERLRETLAVLSDPALLRQVQRSRAFCAKGRRGLSFEAVFGEPLHPRHKRRR